VFEGGEGAESRVEGLEASNLEKEKTGLSGRKGVGEGKEFIGVGKESFFSLYGEQGKGKFLN